MTKLERLVSLKKKRKRVGRGGSRGGTSGRGHKGQKARTSGNVDVGFEGGQMPLYRRLPKRGFTNVRFKVAIESVNIDRISSVFDDEAQVTKEALLEKGIIKPRKGRPYLLKILGTGTLEKKLTVIADKFSESAKKKIEKAGGKVQMIKEM